MPVKNIKSCSECPFYRFEIKEMLAGLKHSCVHPDSTDEYMDDMPVTGVSSATDSVHKKCPLKEKCLTLNVVVLSPKAWGG